MEISTASDEKTTTISLSGHLNTTTAPELEQAIQALDPTPSDLVIDVAGIDYLSSAGLRVLLAAKKHLDACGGTFSVINATDDVQEVFDITGLTEVLEVR